MPEISIPYFPNGIVFAPGFSLSYLPEGPHNVASTLVCVTALNDTAARHFYFWDECLVVVNKILAGARVEDISPQSPPIRVIERTENIPPPQSRYRRYGKVIRSYTRQDLFAAIRAAEDMDQAIGEISSWRVSRLRRQHRRRQHR